MFKFSLIFLHFFTCILIYCTNIPLKSLIPYKIYEIRGKKNLEPSGIIKSNNNFFIICDSEDNKLFQLDINNDFAQVNIYKKYKLNKKLKKKKLDFEALSVDSNNDFYILSETTGCILKDNDNNLDIINTLSKNSRGNVEGLAITSNNTFVVSYKDNPSGLFFINSDSESFLPLNAKLLHLNSNKKIEISDIFYENENIWCLIKNHKKIVKLEKKSQNDYCPTLILDYADTEDNPLYRYKEYKGIGNAEGLCIDEKYIYIVLDNNCSPRYLDNSNTSPLLMIFYR